MTNKPAGLQSRVCLARMEFSRNWDRLHIPRSSDRDANRPESAEGQPTHGVKPMIVDQANAQGNAWDTGEVPDHRLVEPNSTTAEEVKVRCRSHARQTIGAC